MPGRRSSPSCLDVLGAVERGEATADALAAELEALGRRRGCGACPLELLGYVSCSLVGVYSANASRTGCGLQAADVTVQRVPTVLSIAGSDSGGGAGIQADLKAFARCGVHGMTAITAITAQNTRAVEAVEALSPTAIFDQVRAVAEDIGVDAVKIGMLGSPEAVDAVGRGSAYCGVGTRPWCSTR